MILNLAPKIPITAESAAKFTFYLRNINHSLMLRLQLLSLRSFWNNNTYFSKVFKPIEKITKQRLHDYEVILSLHCYSLFLYLSFFFFPTEVVIFCIILVKIHAQTSFMCFPRHNHHKTVPENARSVNYRTNGICMGIDLWSYKRKWWDDTG